MGALWAVLGLALAGCAPSGGTSVSGGVSYGWGGWWPYYNDYDRDVVVVRPPNGGDRPDLPERPDRPNKPERPVTLPGHAGPGAGAHRPAGGHHGAGMARPAGGGRLHR